MVKLSVRTARSTTLSPLRRLEPESGLTGVSELFSVRWVCSCHRFRLRPAPSTRSGPREEMAQFSAVRGRQYLAISAHPMDLEEG